MALPALAASTAAHPLFLALAILFSRASGSTLPADTAALFAFNQEVIRTTGGGIPTWFPSNSSDPCDDDFDGVYCLGDRVVWLQLYGTVPGANSIASLTRLSALQRLILPACNIRGTIPAGLAKLPLRTLDLSQNFLTGSVPDLSMAPLVNLFLKNQRVGSLRGLYGSIPVWMGKLTSVRFLDLSGNSFSGSIPAGLVALPSLVALNLNDNLLSGAIPYLGNLPTTLQTLSLFNNPFKPGPMPKELNQLGSLRNVLDLSNMNLIGGLVNISGLGGIGDLLLNGNRLSGPLIASFLPQGMLGYLNIRNNNFSGPIPNDLYNAMIFPLYGTVDCGLDLANNSFTGTVPGNLADLVQAFVLDFSSNRLCGTLRNKFGYMYGLTRFKVANNTLSGALPSFVAPPSVGYPILMRTILAANNHFTGKLPAGLRSAPILETFDASHNWIAGCVPDMSNSHLLSTFNVSHNVLTGLLPTIPYAQVVDLSNNFLQGPYNLSTISPAAAVDVSYNCLKTPSCKTFKSSSTNGSGSHPACNYPPQKPPNQCRRFCRADLSQPPCNLHGVCQYPARGGLPSCQCDPGFRQSAGVYCIKPRSRKLRTLLV